MSILFNFVLAIPITIKTVLVREMHRHHTGDNASLNTKWTNHIKGNMFASFRRCIILTSHKRQGVSNHCQSWPTHYNDVIMGAISSQITSLTIVYSTVYSDADQRKHQSSASLAFVWGIHRGPVNSPHKWPVTRKIFPFNDLIMTKKIIKAPN